MHSIIRHSGVPEGGSRLVEVSSCSAALSPVASLSPAYIHIHTPASDREKPFPRGGWQSCSDVAKNSISSGVTQSERVSEQSSLVVGCSCLSWRSLLMTGRRVAFPVKMQMPVVLWTTCTCCCRQLPQTLHEHPPCASHCSEPGRGFLGVGCLCNEGFTAHAADYYKSTWEAH